MSMKKSLTFYMVACIIMAIFTSGCMSSGLIQRKITKTNMESTSSAYEIKNIVEKNKKHIDNIRGMSKGAKNELDKDVEDGILPIQNVENKKERWTRVEGEVKEIEKGEKQIWKKSTTIIRVNEGGVQLTLWGWLLIVFIFLIIASYLTMLLKQWGIMKVIKTSVEGSSELIAKSWIRDKNTDTEELPPEMFELISRRKNNGNKKKN